MENNGFHFNISFTVFDHLGRNLYRSFTTILGEAISNSWDAESTEVRINYDAEHGYMQISDNGTGMSRDDLQDKFLKIGYTKRDEFGHNSPERNRPYIGRKGIGKLALLSCADEVIVFSRKSKGDDWVGVVINNEQIDQAIKQDKNTNEHNLGEVTPSSDQLEFFPFEKGTVIYFNSLKDERKHTEDFLRKTIALYFKFTLIDPEFIIKFNGTEVTANELNDLANNTQFIWTINGFSKDPYIQLITPALDLEDIAREKLEIEGFIASVKHPRFKTILGAKERIGIDLIVNGRVREVDIFKHFPTARFPEQYLYGQIHINALDGGDDDNFTTSREGVQVETDVYQEYLNEINEIIKIIMDKWDSNRVLLRESGDVDNPRKTPAQRAATDLFSASSVEIENMLTTPNGKKKAKIWEHELADDAEYNFEMYSQCFISENLTRKLWEESEITPDKEANNKITHWREKEQKSVERGGLSIGIRSNTTDPYYLEMEQLVRLVDPDGGGGAETAGLRRDEKRFTPLRNAVMHTSKLTMDAKTELRSVFNNIKARVARLLDID